MTLNAIKLDEYIIDSRNRFRFRLYFENGSRLGFANMKGGLQEELFTLLSFVK